METKNIEKGIAIDHNFANSLTARAMIEHRDADTVLTDVLDRFVKALGLNYFDLPLQVATLEIVKESLLPVLSKGQREVYDMILERTHIQTIDIKQMRQAKEVENDDD